MISFKWLIFISVSFLLMNCSKVEQDREVPQGILENSQLIFEGIITESVFVKYDDKEAWKVVIENNSGSVIDIYWSVSSDKIIAIEANVGPFNYQLNPGSAYLRFSTVRQLAISAVKSNNITGWSFFSDEDMNYTRVYKIVFDDIREVTIDAISGDILDIS